MEASEIIQIAATWKSVDKGRGRADNGTLKDWEEWASSHPQRDEPIKICRGRSDWLNEKHQMERDLPLSTFFISVVSWNILSDTWYEKDKDVTYTHTAKDEGPWEFRFPRLIEWISELQPDVLNLQEVDFSKFDSDLVPRLRNLGYDGQMQSQKGQNSRQPCGVATFWRHDKFDGLHQTASFSRSMVVVLKKRGTETQQLPQGICVVNIHLESAQTEIGADKRARQLNSPLLWASRNAPNYPLIVSGDCNTGADASLFHALRNHSWHGHNVASVYEHPATVRTLPVCRATFAVPGHHFVIDHMLYSHETLRLCCVLDAFTESEVSEYLGSEVDAVDKGFPNSLCPSDHLPIGAVFVIDENLASPPSSEEGKRLIEKPSLDLALSEKQRKKLITAWRAIQATAPPKRKGRPTPEQIEEGRAFSTRKTTWLESLASDAEVVYAKSLIKGKTSCS